MRKLFFIISAIVSGAVAMYLIYMVPKSKHEIDDHVLNATTATPLPFGLIDVYHLYEDAESRGKAIILEKMLIRTRHGHMEFQEAAKSSDHGLRCFALKFLGDALNLSDVPLLLDAISEGYKDHQIACSASWSLNQLIGTPMIAFAEEVDAVTIDAIRARGLATKNEWGGNNYVTFWLKRANDIHLTMSGDRSLTVQYWGCIGHLAAAPDVDHLQALLEIVTNQTDEEIQHSQLFMADAFLWPEISDRTLSPAVAYSKIKQWLFQYSGVPITKIILHQLKNAGYTSDPSDAHAMLRVIIHVIESGNDREYIAAAIFVRAAFPDQQDFLLPPWPSINESQDAEWVEFKSFCRIIIASQIYKMDIMSTRKLHWNDMAGKYVYSE